MFTFILRPKLSTTLMFWIHITFRLEPKLRSSMQSLISANFGGSKVMLLLYWIKSLIFCLIVCQITKERLQQKAKSLENYLGCGFSYASVSFYSNLLIFSAPLSHFFPFVSLDDYHTHLLDKNTFLIKYNEIIS